MDSETLLNEFNKATLDVKYADRIQSVDINDFQPAFAVIRANDLMTPQVRDYVITIEKQLQDHRLTWGSVYNLFNEVEKLIRERA